MRLRLSSSSPECMESPRKGALAQRETTRYVGGTSAGTAITAGSRSSKTGDARTGSRPSAAIRMAKAKNASIAVQVRPFDPILPRYRVPRLHKPFGTRMQPRDSLPAGPEGRPELRHHGGAVPAAVDVHQVVAGVLAGGGRGDDVIRGRGGGGAGPGPPPPPPAGARPAPSPPGPGP